MKISWLFHSILRDELTEPIGGTGDDLEQIEEQIADAADEVDELVEQLAALDIISEERHNEITERLDTCLDRMTELSSTATNAETPLLTQILSEVATIKGELSSLKSSVDTLSASRTRSESTPEPNLSSEDAGDQKVVETEPETPTELPTPIKPTKSYRVV